MHDIVSDYPAGFQELLTATADTWPGKYFHLVETLALLPRDNRPEGHEEKVTQLIQYLDDREDLLVTKMAWSSGVIICTKKSC